MNTRWAINITAGLLFLGVLWLIRPAERSMPDVTFMLTDGRTLSTAELRGSPLLVNFWSVSCSVCLRDMPRLGALQQSLGDTGLVVIGVAAAYDPPPAVIDLVERRQPGYAIALDVHAELSKAFGGIDTTPTTFLIDRAGNIRYAEFGALDEVRVRATLLTL